MKILKFILLAVCAFYFAACSGGKVKWHTAYYYYESDTLKPSFDDVIIRIDQKGDSIKGWFYCNSDEFETGRGGYLPGFAVVEMLDLKISDSTITFYADPRGVTFLSRPFPLDYKSNAEAMAADTAKYKLWTNYSIAKNFDTVHYAGYFFGDEIDLKGKDPTAPCRQFLKTSEQEVRSRIGKVDYRFVPENTYGEETWRRKGLDPAELDMATYLSEVLFEIDMTYYYFRANGEGGEPSYGDCLLRLKKRADGTYKGWYYGNTDDCTPPRTKGYPGFFAKAMENLTVRDGKISFTVTFADTPFLNRPSPVENRVNIFSLDNSMGDAPCRVWAMQESTPLARDSAVYTGTFGTDGITLDSTAATRARKHFVKITKKEAKARFKAIDTTFVAGNTSPKEYTDGQLRTKQMIREIEYAIYDVE